MKAVRITVDCSNCGRTVQRSIMLPADLEKRASYLVVEECRNCRRREQ